METYSSRRKGCCVRQENACLTTQDEQLIGDLDAMHYRLATSKSQVHIQGSTVGKNGVAVMSEQIRQLRTKLETQATELKTAELRADCSQEAAAHGDILVASLTEELSALREELENNTALCKRAEQQRNQALQNAEKLKEAFKEYKATISIKLTKVMESEGKLKESLVDCGRERERLQMKCTELEKGKVEMSQTIGQLKEEVKCAAGLQAQLEEAGQKVVHFEQQLMERGAEFREVASLRKELENLHVLTRSQDQKVSQSQGEAQQSQAELASLEAILSLLHLREGAVGTLCVRPCMFPPVNYLGTAHLLKLKPGEGYQQLLRVLQSMETERTKQDGLVQRLQERLSRSQEEISSLQSSMSQRASHYQSLHTELLDKVSQATDTEKELKRKSARVGSLEKQLQEKSSAYSQAALTNTELENQLLHYQSLMTKKQREYQQSLDKCKKAQSQQLTEQQHRMEMLQQTVEESRSRMTAMEQELSSFHRERDEAQEAALLLQSSFDQLAQRQDEMRHNEVLLESFTQQAAQSATKVSELQSSLSTCREELSSYRKQMDEMKKNCEIELQMNTYKVSSLQEKLQGANVVCQNSSEQNLQLQLSLQLQQAMLTESTAHISELEESQSELQKQVSSLEQQLERARATLQGEVRNRERDVREKDQNLEEMNEQNKQLSESVSHLTSEMAKCHRELVSKDSELQRLRKDVSDKTSHISRLDESLQHTKRQLDSKSDMLMDLREKLHCCEAERLNCAQQAPVLEGQLQAVRRELAETLEQLRELREVLQTTQTLADERQASVEKLTVQLSDTQRELEERTHEVLDMDNALKERQGELQKRAQLLGHLEVAIRDHKQELERKVISLQQNLQARESKLRDAEQELTDGTKRQHELDQQLHASLQELEETQRHCEALTRELDATKLQSKEKEVRLDGVEEELALKEAQWLQLEAELQSMVTSLELELDLEREQHSKELESLQQTRGQLLKVSEQISSTMLSSQEHLAAKLQQSQNQLQETQTQLEQTKAQLNRTRDQAGHLQTQRDQSRTQLLQNKAQLEQSKILCEQTRAQNSHLRSQLEKLSNKFIQANVQVGQLQTHLQASKKSMEMSNESLLIKESEATRLQARISCLERAADRNHLYAHTASLPAPHTLAHSPESSSSPHKLQTTLPSFIHTRSTRPLSPPAHSYLQPVSSPHHSNQSESQRTCEWLQRSSIDSSLELSQSLKATLREALGKCPWELSSPSPTSSSEAADHSWKGLNDMEATATPDLSFNPLTYMVEKREPVNRDMEDASMQDSGDEQRSESRRESVCTLVGQEEVDMSSLTGMLRFVNQTLAMQEDPSLWNATGLSQTGRILTLQRDVEET
ncbi:coiled-coil domain-containing protein 18 isoform 2-T5 [Spinachia spinachia]